MKGVLFDLPEVIGGARGVSDPCIVGRCEAVGGDFFVSVPEGGDAYLLQHILHDWGDDQALNILHNCHRAMAANGKLVVIEMVIPDDNSPSLGKFLDLDMMMFLHGCERTEREYRALFEQAGFGITRIAPTQSLHSIIEAVRM